VADIKAAMGFALGISACHQK